MAELDITGLARRIERAWYAERSAIRLLQPLAWIFAAVVAARRAAYRRGWLPSGSAGVPVIVVGNVTVGGTGKTPLVEWLCGYLLRRGYRPGIVIRGYGGRADAGPILVSDGQSAADVGDEALLLARRTGVPVCTGRDRLAAARHLVANGADLVIADDGLQHYALERDFEIAVLDASRRLGNGRLLPAGPLREPAGRLREVDLVLVNGESLRDEDLGFRLEPGEAVNLASGERQPLAAFRGQRFRAVAGIGNPQRFYRMLEEAGMTVEPVAVSDHGTVDLAALRESAPEPIIMTEKDAVKYPIIQLRHVWYVPVNAILSTAAEDALARGLADVLPGAKEAGP